MTGSILRLLVRHEAIYMYGMQDAVKKGQARAALDGQRQSQESLLPLRKERQ